MENLRDKYKVELDERKKDKKKIEKENYDPLAYPFGTDEMLLDNEKIEDEER